MTTNVSSNRIGTLGRRLAARMPALTLPRLMVAGACALTFVTLGADVGRTSQVVADGPATTHPTAAAPATMPAVAADPMIIDGRAFASISGRSGFWRIGQAKDGVWWFISPDNKLEFLNTVTTVQPFQLGRRKAGPHYISRDWNGVYEVNSGDLKSWATTTLARVREAGFKGLGAWCNPVFHDLDVPISRDLNLWAHAGYEDRLLYSPGWVKTIEEAVERQVTPLANNRQLVGYYTDNELDWADTGAGPSTYFNDLPENDPNRLKVIEVARRLWPEIAAYNKAFGTTLASYDELATLKTLPASPPRRTAGCSTRLPNNSPATTTASRPLWSASMTPITW